MESKSCMNVKCSGKLLSDWKFGWKLRSGYFAHLCHICGYSFAQSNFCDEFHQDDSGWRECVSCQKRLHCGCIASLQLIELLDDGGGVKCVGCARNADAMSNLNDEKCDGLGSSTMTPTNGGPYQLSDCRGNNGSYQPSIIHYADSNAALGLLKRDELLLHMRQVGSSSGSNLAQLPIEVFEKAKLHMQQVGSSSGSNLAQLPVEVYEQAKLHMSSINMQAKDTCKTIVHPNLNISLGNINSNSIVVSDERDERKMSNAIHQGFGTHPLLSRPPKLALSPLSDNNASVVPSSRAARPPVEGRGRHQLLPRYWPRITDQELQQISGDSNCTIVPLFEKVLSASDAGRIGRLVLPKACAEAYFPPISQPEGLPIKIQDVKGKEWVFQFRYWPNNNSRMYVLEGVTNCIHSMELQAGDTVTFSRVDPGGKLVMGYRKASNSIPTQQPMKGSTDPHINALSRQLENENIRWVNGEKYGDRVEEGLLTTSTPTVEKKKSRNIGSKSKRLLIDSHDIMALKLSWEEVQGLLRPPLSARPTIVVVEDYEFEEYEEPPVFGKTSIFTARPSGIVDQWVQCDSCSKWRRLPADILLPPRWACSENVWDQSRCFCSAPDELCPKELENLLQQSKDYKKRRAAMTSRIIHDKEYNGLDALANVATLGDNSNDPGSSSVAATTKHPRHRPGCSCIVCIQPPSGKGKHKSTCTCTVCMTVKRRFKTLMMRKKKRQSEQEAEIALRNQFNQSPNNLQEVDNLNQLHPDHFPLETEDSSRVGPTLNHDESGKGLDLNFDPDPMQESLRDLLQLASLPLEAYMKHNGAVNLSCEQQSGGVTEVHNVEDRPTPQQEKVSVGDGPDTEPKNDEPS